MASEVEFKRNQSVLDRLRRKIMAALVDLGEDTADRAQTGAPVDTSALINSIRASKVNDNEILVLAGGTASGFNVPYARFREYHNNLHPGTRFYMRNALDWANNNAAKYFKDITK